MENLTTQEKADLKQELEKQLDAIQKQIVAVDLAIIEDLQKTGIKQVVASDGTEYFLFSAPKYDFGIEIYRMLEKKGLLERYKIRKLTKLKLDVLFRDGDLSEEEMETFEPYITVKEGPVTLRKALKSVV